MTAQQSPPSNVFDAAKAVAEALSKLNKEQQQQAIRYASDSLGLQSSAEGQTRRPETSTNPPATHTGPQTHSTDIKQFTEAKAPSSDQQFAAVAAYYYRFEAPEDQRKEVIDLDDLKNAARLAKRRVPGQFALNNAKNAGYLDAAGRGKFKINTVGENLVTMTLPGNSVEGTNITRKRTKRKSTKGHKKKRSKKKTAKKKRSKKKTPNK